MTDELRAVGNSALLVLCGSCDGIPSFILPFRYLGFQDMTLPAVPDHQGTMNGTGHDMAGTELSAQIETLRRDVYMWCDELESLDYGGIPDKDDSHDPKPTYV